ncbi:hypothetical protein H6P81_015240 [Aristolochia fimbriata]|uniref:Uncharacterized protein n=1 Tax=Aristolochia fimbriata TaxID=158543 RepID=A0AAV7E4Q7_ARIFI|nr:hypothetical protein H6P81_015240 [Aristolochia fimbriata]
MFLLRQGHQPSQAICEAASTIAKRSLAQHTPPEVIAMVPALVRVRRETVIKKSKPMRQPAALAVAPRPDFWDQVGVYSIRVARDSHLRMKMLC